MTTLRFFLTLILLASSLGSNGLAQSSAASSQEDVMSPLRRDQALAILHDGNNAVKNHYYDPDLHGVDFAARVQQAEKRIRDSSSLTFYPKGARSYTFRDLLKVWRLNNAPAECMKRSLLMCK